MIDKTKKYGLVLEGGGARGAYEVGVWKAIEELGIKITGVVGTSVGSLNGALIAQKDLDKAINIWENIKYSKIMDVDDTLFDNILNFNFKEIKLLTFFEKLKKITVDKGLNIGPLKKLIEETIDEEKIRNSNIEFGLVTVSLSDLKPMELFIEEIPKGELNNYLIASSYLPGFKREKLNGKHYIDGGFHNNTPISMLVRKGYKDIIVVRILKFNIDQKVDTKDLNIIEIQPKEDLCGIIEFNAEKAKYNINLGYYDTLKVFNNLKGNKYYINCNHSETYFLSRFIKLGKKTKKKFIKDNNELLQRKFIEEGIGVIAKKLKLKRNWTYEDLVFSIIEFMAEKLQLQRFKIYNYREIIDLIKQNLDKYKELVEYKSSSKNIEHVVADIIKVL